MRDFRKNELDLTVVKERLLERRRILPIWEIDHFLVPPNHVKADAEREAQNPSGSTGYSNVTPWQLCSSPGAVVQTESYGQLTCKYVFLNRIRTLAWAR